MKLTPSGYKIEAEVRVIVNGWTHVWSTDECTIEECLLQTDADEIGHAIDRLPPFGAAPLDPDYRLMLVLRRRGLPKGKRVSRHSRFKCGEPGCHGKWVGCGTDVDVCEFGHKTVR